MSSRIIVKNLPKKITEKQLREHFGSKGCITDLQLKYTKNGTFRQFAFVGYKTAEEALTAKEYFNGICINASKIHVDLCVGLGDESKPKAWSKHSRDRITTSLTEEKTKDNLKSSEIVSAKKKKSKEDRSSKKDLQGYPEELQNDKQFTEFLELHKDRKSKPLWADAAVPENIDDSEDTDSEDDESEPEENDVSLAKQNNVSDMDYLKSKVKTASGNESEETVQVKKDKPKPEKVAKVMDDKFTVKLRNLPFRCKKKLIKKFFQPLKIASLRLPPKSSGFAYIKFKSEKDMNCALNKNKGFLDGHQIDVVKYEKKIDSSEGNEKQGGGVEEDKEKNAEILAESGRLFVRNLCYDVSEEELEKIFSPYGQLAEVHLPIDQYTKKAQGFAFISYVFAEHAVKAFTELDGTIFQGRLLHLIPGKPKKEAPTSEKDLTFKKKKEAKLKALSGSTHNWNTLFLGMNAVADSMAKKYGITKDELLNNENKESIAVRMALGETQLVIETRDFLLQSGVQLDSFSQPTAERSKTVIIVKNLPANTASNEIHDVFSKHGIISRIVIPPSGVTALVEFQQGNEAKQAFTKLAYTRFRHLPLYLEWAPMNIFKSPSKTTYMCQITQKVETLKDETKKAEPERVIEGEAGATLFVKNLNFITKDDALRNHFKKCGELVSVSLSKKVNHKTGDLLSMGFGFVQFARKSAAVTAMQDLQGSELDGFKIEIKFSNRATLTKADSERKKVNNTEQTSAKILVRNIPFEVTQKEVRDLFKEFGSLRSVRLPKKPTSEGTHRGFAFVDFITKASAKNAFDALCHSTHLLGRRLVLEWANPNSEDVSELRKKTAKDYFSGGPQKKVRKSKLMEDVMMASLKNTEE